MPRSLNIYVENRRAGSVHSLQERVCIEDVMVHSTDLGVPLGTIVKTLSIPRHRIPGEVVQAKNFVNVRAVRFRDALAKILNEVRERSNWPPMVERSVSVRSNQEEYATSTYDPTPFLERAQRVRQVFYNMGCQNDVVGSRRKAPEVGRLRSQYPAQNPGGQRGCQARCVLMPDRAGGEVDQIQGAQDRIDRPRSPAAEDAAGPSHLQAHATRHAITHELELAGPHRANYPSESALRAMVLGYSAC
jgi:hypothetical protein